MVDFTAIDFETANGFRGSACSLGMVRIRDGKEAASYYRLIHPPEGFDRFDPRNIAIHGITFADVAGAPRFAELLTEVVKFIGDDVVLAHNAGFDLGVIESGMEVSGQQIPALNYACTLTLSRKVYQLTSHALPVAAAHAGFDLSSHHNALADARACAAIAVDIARRQHVDTVHEMLAGVNMQVRKLRPKGPGQPESKATRHARTLHGVFDARKPVPAQQMPDLLHWQSEGDNPVPASDADPNHPLYGAHIVFTGRLGISRQEAKNWAATHGAFTASRVNAATTMLVLGDGVLEEHILTGKHPSFAHRKVQDALRRIENGQHTSLLTEAEFLQMLDANWPLFSAT